MNIFTTKRPFHHVLVRAKLKFLKRLSGEDSGESGFTSSSSAGFEDDSMQQQGPHPSLHVPSHSKDTMNPTTLPGNTKMYITNEIFKVI